MAKRNTGVKIVEGSRELCRKINAENHMRNFILELKFHAVEQLKAEQN